MERLTRPTVKVDETAAQYMVATGAIPTDLRSINDRLLDLVINGPTLNGVNKDVLRQLIRQLYAALQPYEDTGLVPEEVERSKLTLMGKSLAEITEFDGVSIERLKELVRVEKAGRLVVLPCKVGDMVYFVFDGEVHNVRVQGIPIGANNQVLLNFGGYPVQYAWGSEVGKTVFLTREEAERALEEGAE